MGADLFSRHPTSQKARLTMLSLFGSKYNFYLSLPLFVALCIFVLFAISEGPGLPSRVKTSKGHQVAIKLPDEFHELQVPVMNSAKGYQVALKLQDDVSHACQVSRRNEETPLRILSYGLDAVFVPSKALPHPTSVFCNCNATMSPPKSRPAAGAVFVFKAARTGSTFFTSVLTRLVKETKRPISNYWEPFCRPRCRNEVSYQERSLHTLMSKSCKWGDVCQPDHTCSLLPPNEHGEPIFMAQANARFFHANVDWTHIFKDISHPRIIILRRTNLVQMAYSKFHHGGCSVVAGKKKKRGKFSKFDFTSLLDCAEHYALGDQEVSSSHAFQAAEAVSQEPLSLVYEDILQDGSIVQKGLTELLGLSTTNEDIFVGKASTKKVHTKPFCDNANVNCKELRTALVGFPCLFKQLDREAEGLVWTVPMNSDSKIDIAGDCKPLPFLNAGQVRNLMDLYTPLN